MMQFAQNRSLPYSKNRRNSVKCNNLRPIKWLQLLFKSVRYWREYDTWNETSKRQKRVYQSGLKTLTPKSSHLRIDHYPTDCISNIFIFDLSFIDDEFGNVVVEITNFFYEFTSFEQNLFIYVL